MGKRNLDESIFVEEVFCGDFEGDVAGGCFGIEGCFTRGLSIRRYPRGKEQKVESEKRKAGLGGRVIGSVPQEEEKHDDDKRPKKS